MKSVAWLLGFPLLASCGGLFEAGTGSSPRSSYLQLAPTVGAPISESSVSISWTAPIAVNVTNYSVGYRPAGESETSWIPNLTFAADATSGVVTGLPAGFRGNLVLQANVTQDMRFSSNGSLAWTPYGALGVPGVSSVLPMSGTPGAGYAEAMFFSSSFSMYFAHAYLPEASGIFAGLPSTATARPLYNFAGQNIQYPNGFDYRPSRPAVFDIGGIWSDGVGKVAIVDSGAARVVIYDALPISESTLSPARILGQTTWTATGTNASTGSVNARGFNFFPGGGVCFDGTTFYVSDKNNNRILGWHGWPSTMGQVADFVLGQPDLTSNTANNGGVSLSSLSGPGQLACAQGKLVAIDGGNQRVLIWNTAPTSSGIAADYVLGQSSGSVNGILGAGGISAGGLRGPSGVAILPNGSVVVSDWDLNRIVQWNTIPTANGVPFDAVYGQPDRTSSTANNGGMSASALNQPALLSVEPGANNFWVADFGNGRWLRFASGTSAAQSLYGQANFSASSDFMPGSSSATTFAWNQWGYANLACDSVTGSLSINGLGWFTPPANGTVAKDFSAPVAQTSLGGRLYWTSSNQVLSQPGGLTGSYSPDIALGNRDVNGNVVAATTNDYAIAANADITTDGNVLLVADGTRIVGYNTTLALTTSNQPISFAIGQNDLTTKTANGPGLGAKSISNVAQMLVARNKLFVVDSGNNRVMIWNTVPTSTGIPADVILGQAAATTASSGSSLAQMNNPAGIAVTSSGRLIVSDFGNRRLLIWNSIPTVTGTSADSSWDPTSFTFALPTSFATGRMLAPQRLADCGGKLYIGQRDRALVVSESLF